MGMYDEIVNAGIGRDMSDELFRLKEEIRDLKLDRDLWKARSKSSRKD